MSDAITQILLQPSQSKKKKKLQIWKTRSYNKKIRKKSYNINIATISLNKNRIIKTCKKKPMNQQ